MSLTHFWARIDEQIAQLRTATTAQQVVDIIGPVPDLGVGDAFFEGSGGDQQVSHALEDAGWGYAWREASYYWAMTAPDGTAITYIEGDIYLGDRGEPRF